MAQVIDFHVHPFQNKKYCLNFYPEMEDLDAAKMRARIETAGITHICGSVLEPGHIPADFSELRLLNDEALELKRLLGDFYTPGFHVHPAWLKESLEEIERMNRLGVRFIGELVPYMHGWGDFSEKNWWEILDLADQYHMICSYHTPFSYDMGPVVAAHPDITFVAAHPGDKDRVPEHLEQIQKHDNLYLDLSGTGMFRLGLVKHLVHEVGADRILFGTDYPICNPRMYVQAVYGEDISDSDRDKILYENAAGLLARAGM